MSFYRFESFSNLFCKIFRRYFHFYERENAYIIGTTQLGKRTDRHAQVREDKFRIKFLQVIDYLIQLVSNEQKSVFFFLLENRGILSLGNIVAGGFDRFDPFSVPIRNTDSFIFAERKMFTRVITQRKKSTWLHRLTIYINFVGRVSPPSSGYCKRFDNTFIPPRWLQKQPSITKYLNIFCYDSYY